MTPAVVMRPILLLSNSVNQRLPSGPEQMRKTRVGVGRGNSVIVPSGVMRPILLPAFSANQRLPSGPEVMPSGVVLAVGMGNSVTMPAGGEAADLVRWRVR